MNRQESYRAACARAIAARTRLNDSVAVARVRLTPARLKRDARDQAVQTVTDAGHRAVRSVRAHPVATAAAATAFIAYLARRPLAALFGRLHVRWKTRNSENDHG
ncbi:hypothetical protein GGR44_000610 [Sphingobium fontiphilum]|uniref:DUF3618 domain-containing protein n=1 Tax=Sphingobium fontiphilum TaxID=944425 RepID=A0A7W6DE95_9SPHN|nr:hypothetical protein [Sphingobium fontiphilum]MBB3980979.1 hypothetical protein [Sphingobium fontiphilum]